MQRKNVDRHLTHIIAVKNRVNAPEELIGLPATKIEKESDINLEKYVPNKMDEQSLKEELKIMIARDLAEYIDELKWMKDFTPEVITHKYMNETKTVSETVRFFFVVFFKQIRPPQKGDCFFLINSKLYEKTHIINR